MAGYGVTWDNVAATAITSSLYVQKVSRGAYGTPRDARVSVPGRDGEYVFSERRGNRSITADCTLVQGPGTDPDRSELQAVAAWLDKSGYRKLIFGDQPTQYWLAVLDSPVDPDEWRSTSGFQISWSAEPYAYSTSITTECDTSIADNSAQTVTNTGVVDVLPVIEITANGGDIDGFTLVVEGYSLTYAGTITSGSSITINCLNYTVLAGLNTDTELTGAWTPGSVFPASVTGEFPLLVPGSNDYQLDWDGAATSADVCWYYRERSY